jgi:ribosome-binding protein aMBF1 (putative translation factor)
MMDRGAMAKLCDICLLQPSRYLNAPVEGAALNFCENCAYLEGYHPMPARPKSPGRAGARRANKPRQGRVFP